MTAELKSVCPKCRAAVGIRAAQVGRTVRCPKCEQAFEVSSVRPIGERSLEPAATMDGGADATNTAATVAADSATPKNLGRFKLEAILGQGAFGRVYRAYDPQLDRYLALKVPTFSSDDSRRVSRFIAEAKAAARLRHPNIVPTYESGQIAGQYYIAAQFVAGMPLSQRIKENPPEVRQAVDWVRQLAQALAYAHGEAIVHRDIKPANIMLDEREVPQLMDFGLARRIDEDSTMTTDGAIMGTPAYMSPEQASGDNARIGPASDQFSLGVVLYELLTGRRPFEGTPHAVLNLVLTAEPKAIRSLRPEIPRDLEAICQKAMDKDPARRYPDAHAFEADLTRWLDGTPVTARTSRPWERVLKWSKRNPAVAVLTAGILATVVLAFAGVTAALGEAILSRRQAISDRNAAQTARDGARRLAEDLQLEKSKLQTALDDLNIVTNRAETTTAQAERLDEQLKKVKDEIKRAEGRVKEAQEAERNAAAKAEEAKVAADSALKKVAQETERTQGLLAQSYYELGLRRCEDGTVAEGALWLVRSLETLPGGEKKLEDSVRQALSQYLNSTDSLSATTELRLALEHDHPVTAAEFHPQESLAASGDSAGGLHFWDTATGERLHTITAHEKAVRVVAFAPIDGGGLLSAGDDETTVLWRVTKERKLEALNPKLRQSNPVTAAAWSGNGKWILTGSDQGRHLQLWNVGTRRSSGNPFGDENVGRVFSLALPRHEDPAAANNPTALVGTGQLQRGLTLWDITAGKPVAGKTPLPFAGDVRATAFDPKGMTAVAATLDKKVWFIDLQSWKVVRQPIELAGRPTAVACSPTQSLVLAGCDDRTAVLWDNEEQRQVGDALAHGGAVSAVGFHPFGDELLTAGADRLVRIWKLPRGSRRRELTTGRQVDALAVSPDGRRIVVGAGRDLTVWSGDTGARLTEIRERTAATHALAFAPDNQTLLAGDDRTARLWSTRTWKPLGLEMPHSDRVISVAYSRDGRYVASGSTDRTARVWDSRTQKAVCESLPHPDQVTSLVFSVDGRRLITGCVDQKVRVWTWSNATKPTLTLGGAGVVHSVAVSDDDKILAAGCENGEVPTWNADDGEARGSSLALRGKVCHVSFLPRSTLLVTGSAGGVETWDLNTKQRVGPAVKLGGQATRVSGSADGRTWASAVEGNNGPIVVWGSPRQLRTSPQWLATWVRVTTGRQLSETGVVSALSADDLRAARARLAELEKQPTP